MTHALRQNDALTMHRCTDHDNASMHPCSDNHVSMHRCTSDSDYASLLARLHAIPTAQPQRRTYTQAQELAHLVEDLLAECGDATW